MLMIHHPHSRNFFDGQCDRADQRVRGIHPIGPPNKDEQEAPNPKGYIKHFLQQSTFHKRPADSSDTGMLRKLQISCSPCARTQKDDLPTCAG